MNGGWLLDTNVLSELTRPKPDPNVLRFFAETPEDDLFASAVTFAEIRFGIELVDDPKRRRTLNEWLENKLRPEFGDRLLEVTEEIMLRWRLLVEDGRTIGHTFPQPDLLIAATALHYGLAFVSRDTKDFERAGVVIFNPWRHARNSRLARSSTTPNRTRLT